MNCVVNTLIFCRQNEIPEDPEDPEDPEVREGGMCARGRDVCARAGMCVRGLEWAGMDGKVGMKIGVRSSLHI